jgi:hypothetical protein
MDRIDSLLDVGSTNRAAPRGAADEHLIPSITVYISSSLDYVDNFEISVFICSTSYRHL